ncbi:MAG TPA: cytochrome c oxidase subunit II [Candidatus Thermoplasmatota archaeon]|nr:cytochrome c oxidase subunit II [Candidatus Thermoplasmatota archaeon]
MTRLAVPLVVGILLMAPVASAAWSLGYEPASPVGEAVSDLFDTIMIAGAVVFVIVEALLIYTIFKWRKNRKVPKGETERGHTTAEIAWTAVPAIILVWIGILTLQTMSATDLDPPQPDFEVGVIAQQFFWSFSYPDGKTSDNVLRIQEGQVVKLNVRSEDVQHSFWVREFGVKIDAYPDRVNHFWIRADKTGNYTIQCAELCGVGHGIMRGKVEVFPAGEVKDANGNPVPYGGKPYATSTGGREFATGDDVPPGEEITVRLVHTPEGGSGPWGIDPPVIEIDQGTHLHLRIENPERLPHNFSVLGQYNLHMDGTLRQGQVGYMNFTAIYAGEFRYICAVPGHDENGMVGILRVRPTSA